MNTVRVPTTWRAKPISCVTTSMVMPFRLRADASTQNLAPQLGIECAGLVEQQHLGDMASARAMTRCCWPPTGAPDRRPRLSRQVYLGEQRAPMAIAARGWRERRSIRFSRTDVCGQRLKCWNTMPMSERTARCAAAPWSRLRSKSRHIHDDAVFARASTARSSATRWSCPSRWG